MQRRRVSSNQTKRTYHIAVSYRLRAAEVCEGALDGASVAVAAAVLGHVLAPDLEATALRAGQQLVPARGVVLAQAPRRHNLHAAVRARARPELAAAAVRRQLLRARKRARTAKGCTSRVPSTDQRWSQSFCVVHPGRACCEQLRAQLRGFFTLPVVGGEASEPCALGLYEVEETLLQRHQRRVPGRRLEQRGAQLLGKGRRLSLGHRYRLRQTRLEHDLRRIGRRRKRLGVRVQHGGVRSRKQQACAQRACVT